ncbi:hypothetical protein C8Q74DRAFT_1266276 [Fomes fomentarius]|nr:hypothetical protein C8Q74DRAFT_1266276 [Fomes fomentarius]
MAGLFAAVRDRVRKMCNGKQYSPSDVGEPVAALVALDLEALARRAFEEHEMAIAAEIADNSALLDVPHSEQGLAHPDSGLPTRRSVSDERMAGDDDAVSSVSSCWSSDYRVPASTCPPAQPTTKDKTGSRRKQRNKERSRKNRRLKREAAEQALREELQARIVDVDERPYVQYRVPKQVALARAGESTTLRVPYSLVQEKQSSTAGGISESPANEMEDTADYKEIEWDGRHTVILLDADGHFVGALLAGPRKGFDQACKNFEAHMHRARLECGMDEEEHNRRGTFATLTSATRWDKTKL